MRKLSSILFAFLAFTSIACEEEVLPDTKAPAILINSPTEDAEFEQSEDIPFEASVVDESELASVTLSITPPGGAAQEVYQEEKENFTNNNKEVRIHRTLPLSLAGGLAPGRYLLTVHASDIHGNKTEASVGISIKEAETQAPIITLHTPAEGTTFAPGEEVAVKATVTDNYGLTLVRARLISSAGQDKEMVHAFGDMPTEATIEHTFSFEAGTGDYQLVLEAEDHFGNKVNKSVILQVREPDTSAPYLSISNPLANQEFHTDDIISFEARATDEVQLDTVTVRIAGPGGEAQVVHAAKFSQYTTEANIATTISLGAEAAVGNYTITIKAADASGNTTEKNVAIYIRAAAAELPAITIHSPTAGAVFTPGEAISLEATLADASGLAAVSLRVTPPEGAAQVVYSENFPDNTTEAKVSETISLGDNPAQGSYLLSLKATDKKGHSREKSVTVEVHEADKSQPTVLINNPLEGAEFYADETISFQADVADNAGLEEVTVWLIPPGEEARLVHTESPDEFFNNEKEAHVEESLSLGDKTPAAGSYTILLRASDKAGNITEEKVNIKVLKADKQAPTISVHSPAAGSSYQPGDVVSVDATVEDDQQLAEVRVLVTLGTTIPVYENTITEFDSPTYHQVQDTAPIPADASRGTYYVTITATDAAGNSSEETLSFQVTE